jgi:6-phosphogluconate dehydrogenase
MNHYQGIKLIKETSDHFQWNIDTSVLLKTWSGGCIIRSALLEILRNGWNEADGDILRHPYTIQLIKDQLPGIKDTVSKLIGGALPFPVISSNLEYFKGLISSRSNAYLIQAQRDYFGAHTYQRIEDPSERSYHTKWY